MSAIANTITLADGRLRAVCEYCGRKSRPTTPDSRGRVDLFEIALGWSVAPYSSDFIHRDGSMGDLWRCPSCNRALSRGDGLRPTPERCEARRIRPTP